MIETIHIFSIAFHNVIHPFYAVYGDVFKQEEVAGSEQVADQLPAKRYIDTIDEIGRCLVSTRLKSKQRYFSK